MKLGEAAQGANWFVNWADYPSVVAIDEKFWVAHWLAKQSGGKTYDYDVALAISNDCLLYTSFRLTLFITTIAQYNNNFNIDQG